MAGRPLTRARNEALAYQRQARYDEHLRNLPNGIELAREEGFQQAMDLAMPEIVDANLRLMATLNDLAVKVSEGTASKDDKELLKTLLAQSNKLVDRHYGSVTQRQEIKSTSVSISMTAAQLAAKGRWGDPVVSEDIVDPPSSPVELPSLG